MDLNVWGHHHSLSMGGHHAVDDLAGANPGIENIPPPRRTISNPSASAQPRSLRLQCSRLSNSSPETGGNRYEGGRALTIRSTAAPVMRWAARSRFPGHSEACGVSKNQHHGALYSDWRRRGRWVNCGG